MTKARILLVEDEASIAEPLSFLLEREGYEVTWVESGKDALDRFHNETFDLILLDLMIPEVSGTDVCRAVRQESSVPIVMLTAKDSELDIVVGLELGADDYVTKPYAARELLARVQAVLRRSALSNSEFSPENILEAGGIRLDTERHSVSVRGKEINMPLREFELLEMFMRNQGRVLTREQLIDRLWGSDYFGDTKTLDVHVKRVRARVEINPKHPELITTIRGVGYRFH